ncbi:MAG: hypothetical protein RRY13_07590 [Akkermansia sp.]
MMKPITAQYLLKRGMEENKTVLSVFLELADKQAELVVKNATKQKMDKSLSTTTKKSV